MNETYRADTGVAKILYRQIRKHYKRYRYGRWLELAFLLLILGIDIGLFRKAKLPEQFPEVLALAVAVTILLCIPLLLIHAVAISGGYSIRQMARGFCTFAKYHMTVSVQPKDGEWGGWTVPYKDITELIDVPERGYLKIVTVNHSVYYLYAYYKMKQEIWKQVEDRTGKKIQTVEERGRCT